MNYKTIKLQYQLHMITAKKVWDYADKNIISREEAAKICGARPKN